MLQVPRQAGAESEEGVSDFGPEDWWHHRDRPATKAHIYRPAWRRTLCSLPVAASFAGWAKGSTRQQCRACLRRLENAKHWAHLLLERGP